MINNSLSYTICKYTLLALFILLPVFVLFWYTGYFLLVLFGLIFVITTDLILNYGRVWFDAYPSVVYFFFILPIVSVVWSGYPDETLWKGSLVLVNLGIFYLMARANEFKSNEVVLKLVIIIPIVMALVFLVIYFMFGTIRPNSREMAENVGSIANLGPAMTIPCIPYLLLHPHNNQRRIYIWVALMSCLIVVLLSYSRAGIFMLPIAFLVSIILYPRKWSYRVVRLVKVGGVLIIFTGILVGFIGMDRTVYPILERFTTSQLTDSYGLIEPSRYATDYRRALMYEEGIGIIVNQPLTGIGYGSLKPYLEERYGSAYGTVSHNIIITMWGEMGVPGLVLLIWLSLKVFTGLRKYRYVSTGSIDDKLIAAATLSALIVVFIHAQFRPFFSNPIFPIFLAQAYTMIKMTKNIDSH